MKEQRDEDDSAAKAAKATANRQLDVDTEFALRVNNTKDVHAKDNCFDRRNDAGYVLQCRELEDIFGRVMWKSDT